MTERDLVRVFKLLQSQDKKLPLNAALILAYISAHEPCLKQDVETALEISVASGSRNTDYLSDNHRLQKPGLGFIHKEENPDDRRQSVLTLTNTGRDFIHQLIQ